MTDNHELSDLWKKQEAEKPSMDELMRKAARFRKANISKLILTNVMLLATSVFIIFIWYQYQPALLTTKAGIVIIIGVMAIYLVAYNQLLPLLLKAELATDSAAYLQNLLAVQQKFHFLHSTMTNVYFLALSVGIGLYLIEPVSRMSITGRALAYGITFAWVIFNWLVIRPRAIKKQQVKINELLTHAEELKTQLSDD